MIGKDDSSGKAIGGSGEPTRIVKPTPGGRPARRDGAAPPSFAGPATARDQPGYRVGSQQLSRLACAGLNPLEAAASTLLDVLAHLRDARGDPDPQQLHESLAKELRQFETLVRTARVEGEDIFVARYVLCTALDDAVLSTDWGSRSSWSQQPLLYLFHKEKKGGVRFFEILGKLLQTPREHLHLLQLMFICLVLGYQGRYRNEAHSANELRSWRERVFREIRQDHPRELSLSWRGVSNPRREIRRYISQWAVVATAGLIVASVYSVLAVRINQASDPVFEFLSKVEVSSPTLPVKQIQQLPVQQKLQQLLAEDIAAGAAIVNVGELDSRIVLSSSSNGGLYQSGQAEVKKDYLPLIERVADALAALPGKILVVGHTDNIPPRRGFPSNYELSLARAQTVERLLRSRMDSPERFLAAEGRGASEPMVPNDKPAERALNRRAEIRLLHFAEK